MTFEEAQLYGLTLDPTSRAFLMMFFGGYSTKEILSLLVPTRGKLPEDEEALEELVDHMRRTSALQRAGKKDKSDAYPVNKKHFKKKPFKKHQKNIHE